MREDAFLDERIRILFKESRLRLKLKSTPRAIRSPTNTGFLLSMLVTMGRLSWLLKQDIFGELLADGVQDKIEEYDLRASA